MMEEDEIVDRGDLGADGAVGDHSNTMDEITETMRKVNVNGVPYEPLADGEYDAIVLGTGLTECVISGILSVAGLKVLHADKNDYYGGQSASVSLAQLFDKFKESKVELPKEVYGSSRDYNIDLIPKFIIGNGDLVRLFLHCDVAKYLEFRVVEGSFVYSGSRPHKVPVTAREAMTSGLLGLWEKNRCRQFFSYVHGYNPDDPEAHEKKDLKRMTMRELFKYYGLQADTIEFVGHALALYTDDTYLDNPAEVTVKKIQLYANSLLRFSKSPYLYPLYGLGELPQAFARLSAVHGGTFMLNTPIDEILYNGSEQAIGIKSDGKVATCKYIVAAPEYFREKSMPVAKVVRCYCILAEPPPHTRESGSCQIVIPAAQARRKTDIYVLVLSADHKVTPEGRYVALVSTTVETDNPAAEIQFGLNLLGHIIDKVVTVDEVLAPRTSGNDDKVFLSRGYDATTHFQTTSADVFDLYKRVSSGSRTGKFEWFINAG